MRTNILILATLGALTAFGSVVKTPAACSSRPCVYLLDCAATTCTAGEVTELQTSLDDSQRGDTITLTAGKVWGGSFSITARTGASGYLTINSSASANLPPAGVRVTPSHSGNMPKLKMTSAVSALLFPTGATSAKYIRLIGIEIYPDTTINGTLSTSADLVRVGAGDPLSAADVPNFIEFDRCYVHGSYVGEIRNAILANGDNLTVRNSYISEIKMAGIETHAIVAYNSTGPFTFYNNYFEATAIPVLIGGGAQTFDAALPSDLDFYYNFFTKPLKWFSTDPDYVGVPYTNKNMLEYKIANRSNIRWNVFDQNFKGPNNDQSGQFVSFNMRLPNGLPSLPYAVTQDILFSNNVLRKAMGTWGILGSDSNYSYQGLAKRITIRNNLFQEIGCYWDYENCLNYTTSFGRLIGGGLDFIIENNTFHTLDNQTTSATGHALLFDGTDTPSITNFSYKNNIAPSGGYAWKGDGLGIGSATVNGKTLGVVTVNNNVMPGQSANWGTCLTSGGNSRVCTGNFFPTMAEWQYNSAVKWIRPTTDFKLKGTPSPSSYLVSSTTGGQLGADISQLPLIRNARVVASAKSAVLSFDLSAPILSIACVLEVSTSRNLTSKLAAWTSIADLDPVIFTGADLSTRTGNVASGASIAFVIGKDATESSVDRNLAPSTTHYYRLMCGGDSVQGSFVTAALPSVSTRSIAVSVRPPSGIGITQASINYGEKETGAPGTLVSSIAAIPCTASCSLSIPSASNRTQYVQVRYLNVSSVLVGTAYIRVIP